MDNDLKKRVADLEQLALTQQAVLLRQEEMLADLRGAVAKILHVELVEQQSAVPLN